MIESHLGLLVEGILLVDRYSAYTAYAKRNKDITLAFCWAHARRDFRDAGLKYQRIRQWAESWVERIDELVHLNALRVQYRPGTTEFTRAEVVLTESVRRMKDTLDAERRKRNLHHAQRSVLTSLANHWEGLTVFLTHSQIPMDTNGSERILRNPVVGRKNYYGSVTQWSARFTAVMFSIFETLALWNIGERRARTAIARRACERLGWYRADGALIRNHCGTNTSTAITISVTRASSAHS